MKVTKGPVYRITVETKCGCKAAGEYADAHYRQPLGDAKFYVCEKHKDRAEIDILEMTLLEFVEKEALDAKTAANLATLRAAQEQPQGEDEAPAENVVGEGAESTTRMPLNRKLERTASVGAAPTANGSNVPPPMKGPRRDPLQVTKVNRGGVPTGGQSQADILAAKKAALAASAAAGAPARGTAVEMQIDEVPENPKITDFIDENLLGDPEDDPSKV